MKKFFSFLAEYSRFLVTSWWPPCLWREIAALKKELAGQPDEPTARAMLMQLRVHQESVRQRIGYMVSAFIPNGAVEKLIPLGPEKQKQFASVVAEALVSNAIHGILKRSQANNKLTALMFEPLSPGKQNVQLVGAVFETDQHPGKPNVPELKQLHDAK